MSNAGPPPEKVLKKLRNGDHPVPVYFVAFDVAADLFKPVKEEGAMVVSASDESPVKHGDQRHSGPENPVGSRVAVQTTTT